jgi:hypothetical protein
MLAGADQEEVIELELTGCHFHQSSVVTQTASFQFGGQAGLPLLPLRLRRSRHRRNTATAARDAAHCGGRRERIATLRESGAY